MKKTEILDALLLENKGYLKSSDAFQAGISRAYLGDYVRKRGLERAAQGLYMAPDAWVDDMFVIQSRYPQAVFSHETALYLLNLAEREPTRYAATLRTGASSAGLTKCGLKVYKIKHELFEMGIVEAQSHAKHTVRIYNAERTVCDMLRSRRNVEIQDLQAAIKGYVRTKEKNIPLLMRYAKLFSVEKAIRQYLEVLL